MKRIILLIFLFFSFNSFSIEYLIRCERKNKNDLIYLLEKKLKVVDETTYSLFLVLNEEEKEKIEKEYFCEILDQDPQNFEYYRIGLREDTDHEKIKLIGKELYKEENWVLIRIYPGANIGELKEAKVFAGKLNLKGFKMPKSKEEINLFFLPDPIVQKIVNSVSISDIDNFWNQLTTNSPYGTRYSTSQGCFNAANWCLSQFQSFGLQTQTQNHTSGHAPNVIGIHYGAINPDNIYIVEGHLDDMPSSGLAPGADDNASGSVHVLEAAKVLSCWGFKNTLKFLLLTGEEFGLYGSEYYASQASQSGENILGVINMDMPGWEGNGIPNPENLDLNYNSFSEDLGLFYAQVANIYSTGLVVDAFLCPSLNASDHYPFWQAGYKAICGITDNEGYCGHSGSYPYYHTSNDTIWNCGNQSNNHSFFYSTVKTTVAAMAELGKPFKITFNKNSYGCSGQVQVILADRDLNTNPSTQQSYQISIWSNIESTPEILTLYEDGVNSIYFKGTINLTTNPPSNGDGYLSISENSTIYTSYTDSLDCDGQTNVQYSISAPACTPPIISNVQVTDITPNSATITWQTNVPSTSKVTYGTSTPPYLVQENLDFQTDHSVTLNNLSSCTPYYFSVTSTDEGGNSKTDNNNGNWYQFTTLGAIYLFGPDDVEGGTGNWVASGQFHRDTCKAHSGSYSWKAGSTTCPGTYNPSTTSRLTLNQSINLGQAGHGYHLKFWEYYKTEAGYDFCRPQISTDGGTTWITLGTQYSGQSGGWVKKDYDLSSYSGNIRIRFEFSTDSYINDEGWYIDDIEISKNAACSPDLKFNSSSFIDTCNGTGNGSNNGIIDPGEEISLSVTLKNNGIQNATGISSTISTTTEGITIIDNFSTFPDISGSGGTGTSIDGFSFKVDSSLSCGTQINFNLNINSNEGSWSDNFSLTVGQFTGGGQVNLWSESFDGTTFPPSGWGEADVSGTAGEWERATGTVHPSGGGTHSGAGLAYFNSYTAPAGNFTRLYRTSPTLIPSNASSASLVLWMYHDTGFNNDNDRIQIQVSLNGSNWTNVGAEIPRYDGSTGWKQHTIDLSSYTGQSIYTGILGISAYGNDCHIDDVSLKYSEPLNCNMNICTGGCNQPSQPQIINISDNNICSQSGITITFNQGVPSTRHDLYKDSTLVQSNIASPLIYNPEDTLSHSYVIRAINGEDSCFTDSNSQTATDFNHTPFPTISGDTQNTCPSTSVLLSTQNGMSNYKWYRNGEQIYGANSYQYNASLSGDYTVSYTNNYGCSGTSLPHSLTILPCTPNILYQSHSGPLAIEEDGDGIIEAGELWQITLTLTNNGNLDATNVLGYLSGEGIIVCNNPGNFGNIPISGTGNFTFKFIPDPDYWYGTYPCGSSISFDLINKSSNGGSFTYLDDLDFAISQVGVPSQTINIFLDDFENLNNWVQSPPGSSTIQSEAHCPGHSSNYVLTNNNSSIIRAQSTVGYSNIYIIFDAQTIGFDLGENLYLDWYNGSSWINAWFGQVPSWQCGIQVGPLPSGANNNPNFQIRFRNNANQTAEKAKIDYVIIKGETLNNCGNYNSSCPIASPKPIPDGRNGTNPMKVSKISSDGSQLSITWDDQCNPINTNIIYGPLSGIFNYQISGSKCNISNPDNWNIGSTTDIWFILVSDNGAGTESSWGLSSWGQRNGSNPSGQCGNTLKDNSGTCP